MLLAWGFFLVPAGRTGPAVSEQAEWDGLDAITKEERLRRLVASGAVLASLQAAEVELGSEFGMPG